LPSEAEREYAARGGTTGPYSFSGGVAQAGKYAWYSANSGGKTNPVDQKFPNAWGLHDMQGNAWEWNQDCWQENYVGAPIDGSAWQASDCKRRVLRGGSWGSFPDNLQTASRSSNMINFRGTLVGFRLVQTAGPDIAK
jgi:formylglycine-generating enzyme required for sulfatase activity